MTTLGLSDTPVPDRWLARINWPVLVPWLVAALMAANSGYHRFLTQETNRAQDAAAIEKLTTKVDALTGTVTELRIEVRELRDRMDRERTTVIAPPRGRQFDH